MESQDVFVLDSDETTQALAGRASRSRLSRIADSLMPIVGTDQSVFATGLTEGTLNSLRTRMYRRNIALTVRKVTHEGVKGHVIVARKVEEAPDGL